VNALRVIDAVAEETRIPAREILGKSRLRPIVMARRKAMRKLYVEHGRKTPELAELFDCLATSVRHHLIAAGVELGAATRPMKRKEDA